MDKYSLFLMSLMVMATLSGCSPSFKPTEKGTYAVMDTSMGEMVFKLWPDKAPLTVENFTGLASGTKEWTDPKSHQKVKRPLYNGLIFHRVIKDFMLQGGDPLGNGTGGPGYIFKDECVEYGDPVRGTIKDDATAMMVWSQLIVPYMQKSGGNPSSQKIAKLVQEVMTKQSGKPLFGQSIEALEKEAGAAEPVRQTKPLGSVDYGTICMANSGPDSNGSQFFIVTKKDGCPWLNGKHTVFGNIVQGMDVALAIQDVKTLPGDKPAKDVVIKSVKIVTSN